MFMGITEEQLDLLTLEQVRMWSWARRLAADAGAMAARGRTENSPGWSGAPAAGPARVENGGGDDYSWMDDLQAAGGATA
jgi:hypothetical protein